jgi:hypothetical protein
MTPAAFGNGAPQRPQRAAHSAEDGSQVSRQDLDMIFAPVSTDNFFARYWQREPLRATRKRQDCLLTLADVDELVSSITSLDDGWLMLTKDGVPKTNASVRSRDGSVDLAAIYAAYDDGYTLILTMLQQRWPAIRVLCRDLERDLLLHGVILSRGIRANLYLTPADARGFDPHYDNHDVIVLQLEGDKNWRVYGQHRPRPIHAQRHRSEQLPPLVLKETMRPGQSLYLPRGFYHEASTGKGFSMHLTLSVSPITWIDLMTRMLPSLESFCETLPLLPQQAGDASLREQFDQLLRLLLESGDAAQVARSIADESLIALDPLLDDGFGQRASSRSLTLDTRVRRRRGAIVRLRSDGTRASLIFPGSGFRGPNELAQLFRFIVDHDSFRIGELPDVVTGDSKIEVVRQLVGDGLLRVESNRNAR